MSEVDADAVVELPQEEASTTCGSWTSARLNVELRGHRPLILHLPGRTEAVARNAWMRGRATQRCA